MVVDHVEDDADAEFMRAIHEAPEFIGPSIQPGRRIEIDAVVPPPEPANKVSDRHHLDKGDAQIRERFDLPFGSGPCAFGRERTDVHLVQHVSGQADSSPMLIRPVESCGVDDGRWTVGAGGLMPRKGVGPQPLAIQPEPVGGAGCYVGNGAFKHSVFAPREGVAGAAINNEVHALALGRPDSNIRGRWVDEFDASRQSAL